LKTGKDGVGQTKVFKDGGLDMVRGHSHGSAHAMDRWHDGEAEFDIAGGRGGFWLEREGDSAFLGDIYAIRQKLGHDHETGNDGAARGRVELLPSFEEAVDPEAEFVVGGGGLDMDVGGAVLDGGDENRVYKGTDIIIAVVRGNGHFRWGYILTRQ